VKNLGIGVCAFLGSPKCDFITDNRNACGATQHRGEWALSPQA
jgi:hypothetical protein